MSKCERVKGGVKEGGRERRAKPPTEGKYNVFAFTYDFLKKCNWFVICALIHSLDIY